MTEHKHKWTLYRIIYDAENNVNRRYHCLECPKEGQKLNKYEAKEPERNTPETPVNSQSNQVFKE